MRVISNLIFQIQTELGNIIRSVLPVTSEYSGFVLAIGTDGSVILEPVSAHALNGSFDTQANAGGNSVISPSSGMHSEIITFTGAAGTRICNIVTAARTSGDTVAFTALLPATPGVRVQVTNGTVGGTVLFDYRSDGLTRTFFCRLVFDGVNWQPQFFTAPAY